MFARAVLAFLILPGFVAILAPSLIAPADQWRGGVWVPGLAVMLVGMFILLWCVRDFYISEKGTLAPWDPPKKMVNVGLYRYVRNPMYIGVLILVLGWAFFLSSVTLAAYTVVLVIGFHIRVLMHEEPWLESKFGEDWKTYKACVPRWMRRLTIWGKRSIKN